MDKIQSDTPLMMLTVSQFQALVASCFPDKPESNQSENIFKRYVYGLKGISELFNCSHTTAQYLKDNVITEAVSQNGRKIIVDADLAVKLFQTKNQKKP